LQNAEWRRIAGLRVVVSWPQGVPGPPPGVFVRPRARVAGVLGVVLIMSGLLAVGVALLSQVHAPQPSATAAGTTGSFARGPWLRRSPPVSVEIPAIGVDSDLLHLGVTASGTMRVPSLSTAPGEAAWYKYSPTPGQIGVSVIEGHVDSYQGPAVFFRLGALRPGDRVDVKLADGVTAIFRVTGVREYLKSHYPAQTIYGTTHRAALRLITCGGAFNYATRHYLSSTVVFASLASSRHPTAPTSNDLGRGHAHAANRHRRRTVSQRSRTEVSSLSRPRGER
jgi:Sortase domain